MLQKFRNVVFSCRHFSVVPQKKATAASFGKLDKGLRSQRVYSWGYAATGSLGLAELNETAPYGKLQINHPYNMMYFKKNGIKIDAVGAGCGFTLFSSSLPSKKLMGSGINTDSQMGCQILPNGKPAAYITQFVEVNLPQIAGENVKVVDIAAGRAHSLVLTNEGKAYAFGNNAYGQCGRKIHHEESYVGSHVVNEVNVGEPIKGVYAGQDHSIVLTKSGRLFTFGITTDGQLGRKCERGRDGNIALVKALANVPIKEVATRSDSVLAISEDGVLYGWGNNEYSQIQPLAEWGTQLFEPVEMTVNKYGKIASCASGSTCCLAITSDGKVFSWGYGPLGRGPEITHEGDPKEIPPALFGKNDLNPKSQPKSASAGIGYFFVTTKSGELYSWGRNRFGTCGLGLKEKDMFFPMKIEQRLFHQRSGKPKKKSAPELAEFSPQSLLAKLIAASPEWMRPYLRLIRLERPIGVYLLYLPTAWGTALGADPGSLPSFSLLILFFIGATLMRSAGCIINDVWDQRFDRKVERTRSRPIAAGDIHPYSALAFAGSLSLTAAVVVLLPLNLQAQLLALSVVPLALIYPTAKRFTHWPQIALGLAFSWGIPIGYVAATNHMLTGPALASLISLYTAGVFWTLFYDSIYAYQDYEDDIIAGVRSTALKWGRGEEGQRYLKLFAQSFFLGTAFSFYFADLNKLVALIGLAATANHLIWQIRLVGNLENKSGECGRAFRSNANLGLIVLGTIIAGRLI